MATVAIMNVMAEPGRMVLTCCHEGVLFMVWTGLRLKDSNSLNSFTLPLIQNVLVG